MKQTPETGTPVNKQAFIPVEAADMARDKRKKTLLISTVIVLVIFTLVYVWKLRTDPIEARNAFDSGEKLMRAQRYNEAAISFSQTIGLQPGFTEAYFQRGRAYSNLFTWDKAIADFTKLASLQPKDARAYLYRGQAWVEQKDFGHALQDANTAIECDPKMNEAYNLRGVVKRQQGDTTAAMQNFNRAIEIQPNADNYLQRGSLYMDLGQHAKAEADFTIVIQFLPDAAHPYFARAAARRALGNEKGAKEDHTMGRKLDGSR